MDSLRVTVLELVCEQMAERVVVARQEGEDSRARQTGVTLGSIVKEIRTRKMMRALLT